MAGQLALNLNYRPVAARVATFKAGLAARVHRWFRLTPSFGPDLVHQMLDRLNLAPGETVLDPFAGASTTLIECQLEGIKSIGFEINPFLHFVGRTSINWALDPQIASTILADIEDGFANQAQGITFGTLEEHGFAIPPIHDPLRWWRPDVLTHLLLLKREIDRATAGQPSGYRDFFRLALAGILVPNLTNVTLGRLQLHFIDRSDDDIQVWNTFHQHAAVMIDDLGQLKQIKGGAQATLYHADATMPPTEKVQEPISCVVTSPPYPNRYSYVWNTRPHLYMLDFFSTAKEASTLDLQTIGGTWGTATSSLAKGVVEPASEVLKEAVGPLVEQIRHADGLMANYVMKYFNLLAAQIQGLGKLPQQNLRCAYVVGNSRIKGVYVETDVLLANLFKGLGYSVDSIDRIRKRHSGKDLHESVVFARKLT